MTSYQQIVGVLGGLTESAPQGGPLTPAALIETYCRPGMASGWSSTEREHSTLHAGFCGYDGQRGFDDGYDWMAHLEASGWRPEARSGDWPYVVYMLWPALSSDQRYAIAHYCEGDFAVEVFQDRSAAAQGLTKLRAERPAP